MNDLERQARSFENTLANYKNPGNRTLEAASAYEKIAKSVTEAEESGLRGSEAADEAQNMVRCLLIHEADP